MISYVLYVFELFEFCYIRVQVCGFQFQLCNYYLNNEDEEKCYKVKIYSQLEIIRNIMQFINFWDVIE